VTVFAIKRSPSVVETMVFEELDFKMTSLKIMKISLTMVAELAFNNLG